MNGDRDPVDEWSDFDDTLADGRRGEPLRGDPPYAAKPWLAGQRSMHGLLRAMYANGVPDRAAGKEATIERIRRRTGRRTARRSGRWLIAAAAMAAVVLLYSITPRSKPEPAARDVMARVADRLAQPVDRRFAVNERTLGPGGRPFLQNTMMLTTRSGMHFVIEGRLGFGPMQMADSLVGCDGSEMWVQGQKVRHAERLEPGKRPLALVWGSVDPVYLDLHALVQRLARSSDLRVVGRETGAEGTSLLRLEARCDPNEKTPRLRSVRVLCHESTGEITRLEIDIEGHKGHQRLATLDYLGPAELDETRYRRPW